MSMTVSRLLYIFWFLHQTTTGYLSNYCQRTLYIFWFLHQTTTINGNYIYGSELYIFWFLHQTTTQMILCAAVRLLYIFWFLNQTTTRAVLLLPWMCCISFDSYIKPQRSSSQPRWWPVVYLLIPTSNHNGKCPACENALVVYLLIPTSNHNTVIPMGTEMKLYIFSLVSR